MSNSVSQKKRGRPATGQAPRVGVRFPSQEIERIQSFADASEINVSEAIRRLTDIALLGLPVVVEELLRLEAQTDDPEALSTAARLRDILNRK